MFSCGEDQDIQSMFMLHTLVRSLVVPPGNKTYFACVLCRLATAACVRDRETEKENKCCFWAPGVRELVSLLMCACVYKGGGCRQTGSRGLEDRTGHHNSSGLITGHGQTGRANADGSLDVICHQQPTKSVYLCVRAWRQFYSHPHTDTHSTRTRRAHTHTG